MAVDAGVDPVSTANPNFLPSPRLYCANCKAKEPQSLRPEPCWRIRIYGPLNSKVKTWVYEKTADKRVEQFNRVQRSWLTLSKSVGSAP